ncbi:OmpA family protein [Tellurirhabdus rosea]|uniref:OmpA family protein n=1 Tax=Tellurirhabdus rosea TaxID=2674997 RepID=UPI00224E3E36|nr:OmpA family protein [Tellurirhabdus rosea]
MFRLLFLASTFFVSQSSFGQSVLWASSVAGVSSEAKGEPNTQQYRASQALGMPNRLPGAGDNPCAWAPLYPEGLNEEYISLRYEKTIPIRQIAIFESGAPGAVSQVLVSSGQGRETVVYKAASNTPTPNPLLIFPEGEISGNIVKVVLNPSRVKGANMIDAVGISSEKQPISIGINVAKDAPKDVVKENLGRLVNSKGQEVAPVISPDGRTLYFTRGEHPGNVGGPSRQDVWYSRLEAGGTWSEAVNIGTPINGPGDNAISGISADGKTLYLVNVPLPDGGTRFGFSRSGRGPNGWSFPAEMKVQNNYNKHKDMYTEFTVSADGRTMVLSVQRNDSQGDKDLYVSFVRSDLTWSEPKSLGTKLNTADYEGAPFLAADGKTLYFTSSGRPEYGKGDIFVTRRLDDTWLNWSEPENLGPAINTPEWDGYITIPAAGDYAYTSSVQNSLGEEDIFRFKLPASTKPEPVAIFSGQVIDSQSKRPVPATIRVRQAEKEAEFARMDYEPTTGDFKLVLPTQKIYQLTASREGYFATTETVDLQKEKRYREIRKVISLFPIKAGQKVILREVLFEQSKPVLLPGSEEELNRLVDILKQYPQMEILVEGHTDNQGDWNLNMKLSEDRVRTVKSYLADKGVADSRVQTKAWGPSKPIASNETEEKRRLNRRVEFTILKL